MPELEDRYGHERRHEERKIRTVVNGLQQPPLLQARARRANPQVLKFCRRRYGCRMPVT